MTGIERIIFATIFIAAILFFLKNVFRLFAILCLGKWENRFDHLWSRLGNLIKYGFGQKRVVAKPFGINHFFIFWSFMTLTVVYVEFLIGGMFPKFNLRFLGDIPYGIILGVADVMSLVAIVAILIAVTRRTFFRKKSISANFEAYFIPSLIAILMVAYFVSNSCEARLGHLEMISWQPITASLASFWDGMDTQTVHLISRTAWWIHAVVLLFFLNYLPYSKHLHILASLPNCFFKSDDLVSTVPLKQLKKGEDLGISKVVQFTWKDILDFMACTECGRCQDVCPVSQTGKVLNPKGIIHECKLNIFKNGDVIRASRPKDMLASAPLNAKMQIPLINGSELSVAKEALWGCTTCGACMEACPVFIEHAPKIVQMRQHLVMEKSDFPHELITFFEASEQRVNPWGIAPTDRIKWAMDLKVPLLSEVKQADYLFFTGCAGSFDSRARRSTNAFARILNQSGISWASLGNEEKCCGDSQRKLGNEYVFNKLAVDNIATFKKYGVKKIITQCPHCFNTLKNDYKQYGIELEVIHHTQLINTLIAEGKIKVKQSDDNKTVFHDSCYIGRYNRILDEPRDILKACNGHSPLEMAKNKTNSFCCGAGGGRMWMDELPGKRIYHERTLQALDTKASTIAVSCPYCMTMFEDGLKEEKNPGQVKVRDIAELVADTMIV